MASLPIMPFLPFLPFLRPLPLPRLSSIHLLQRQISSLPRLGQQGNGLPVPRPHVHLLTANCQQLPKLYQRCKSHHRSLLLSNPPRNSILLPFLHFPITSTALHLRNCQFITSPNAAEISIRLEYGRLKGTSKSLEKRLWRRWP